MKNKFKIIGMLAMVLVLGLAFVGCKTDADDPSGGGFSWPAELNRTLWKRGGEDLQFSDESSSRFYYTENYRIASSNRNYTNITAIDPITATSGSFSCTPDGFDGETHYFKYTITGTGDNRTLKLEYKTTAGGNWTEMEAAMSFNKVF